MLRPEIGPKIEIMRAGSDSFFAESPRGATAKSQAHEAMRNGVDPYRSEAGVLVAVVVALTGLIGLLVGATMLMSYSMMGGMMGFGPIGGAGWWAAVALVVAGALGIAFAVFSLRPYTWRRLRAPAWDSR